jgi:hypothetical protein
MMVEIIEGVPEYDDSLSCPHCGSNDKHTGYGMIGGGMGPYTLCANCGMLISKSEDKSCDSHEENDNAPTDNQGN